MYDTVLVYDCVRFENRYVKLKYVQMYPRIYLPPKTIAKIKK